MMSTNTNYNDDAIIIGGGLAGLTAALHLSKQGLKITLIEKKPYPRHKVCGEYVSNEVLPYLKWLDVDPSILHPAPINNLEFTTQEGKKLKTKLPLGGLGISRYAFDNLLYEKAKANGVTIQIATVTSVTFAEDTFTIVTQNEILTTKIVLGAFGKHANIDHLLERDFIHKPNSWMAVKAHYAGDFPHDLVALHNFDGGYCGLSKIEDNKINMCYLTHIKTFKKYKNITAFQYEVLNKNKSIQLFFTNNNQLFEKSLTISQISFDKKTAVDNHILMIGDAAGLIHPLCGNGMAMAIHGARIASKLIIDYYTNKITSRQKLEKAYTKQWEDDFGKRLLIGRFLAKALQYKITTALLVNISHAIPSLLPWIIKQTHGKLKVLQWA